MLARKNCYILSKPGNIRSCPCPASKNPNIHIIQVSQSWNPYRKRVKVAPGERPVPGLEVIAMVTKVDDEKDNR